VEGNTRQGNGVVPDTVGHHFFVRRIAFEQSSKELQCNSKTNSSTKPVKKPVQNEPE